MAEQVSQNYANHVRKLPPLFMASFLILAVNVLWSIYGAVRNPGPGAVFHVFFTAELRPRIGEFTTKQLIGLRFASDAELPALAGQVLNGQLTELDAIKRAVKDWRADWQRA